MTEQERIEFVDEDRRVTAGPVMLESQGELSDDGIVIEYTLESDADIPVNVQFDDQLPPAHTDVGFNPKSPPDAWWMDDHTVTIQQTVEANGKCQFQLGVIVEDVPDQALDRPPAVRWASRQGRSTEPLVRIPEDEGENDNEIAADTDTAESTDQSFTDEAVDNAPESDMDQRDSEPPEGAEDPFAGWSADESLNSGAEEDEPWGSFDGEPAQRMQADAASPAQPAGSVLSALAEELGGGETDEDALGVVRDAVGPSNTETVRLRHLQSRMDDFVAYVDVFEEFIEEHGTFQEFAADVEADVDRLSEIVEPLESRIGEIQEVQTDVRSDVSEMESALAELRAELDDQERTLKDDIAELREEVRVIKQMRNDLLSALGVDGDNDS